MPPIVVSEARIGEMVETLWDHRQADADPLIARVFLEALRVLRRAPHAESMFQGETSELEAFNWQISRLAALEAVLDDYLEESPEPLCRQVASASLNEQRDLLLVLADLRSEAAPAVLPLLALPRYPHAELVLEVLTWSSDPRVAPLLRQWVLDRVPLLRRAQKRRRSEAPARPSISAEIPYTAILRALRGHPSRHTEAFLLLAARDWDPTYRSAAISSLGWWEPMQPEVQMVLQDSRKDPSPEVRQSARAALARLGERQALQWFRQTLTSEDSQRVREAIHLIAAENLTLLWPDLDRLADAEELEVAHDAREALERLCEELDRRRR